MLLKKRNICSGSVAYKISDTGRPSKEWCRQHTDWCWIENHIGGVLVKHISEHAAQAITRIIYERMSLEEADHAMDALKRAAGEDEWRPLSPHHQSATAPVHQLFESQFQQAPSLEEQPNPRDLPEATRAHEG